MSESLCEQITLVDGINDSEKHARDLVEFFKPWRELGIKIKINLLPCNSIGPSSPSSLYFAPIPLTSLCKRFPFLASHGDVGFVTCRLRVFSLFLSSSFPSPRSRGAAGDPELRPSHPETTLKFRNLLVQEGFVAIIRRARGDADGECHEEEGDEGGRRRGGRRIWKVKEGRGGGTEEPLAGSACGQLSAEMTPLPKKGKEGREAERSGGTADVKVEIN